MSRRPSLPRSVRVLGEGAPKSAALQPDDGARDVLVGGGVGALRAAVPDATTLAPGSLCLVGGDARRKSVLVWLRGSERVSAAERCALLVARGYRGVGAGELEGLDLAWGFAPDAARPE